ncbi:MAG: sulfite exporter TauE/SafE family protein [Acidobacteria bacterium]|nr:sulfite exporter TauE/SafE family protein [Acidobacteriota bacterium]
MLIFLCVAAFFAGIFNTMAAGGSFLMLPLLIMAGLPATVANGTNRISLLAQNSMSVYGFHRKRIFDLETSVRLMIPALLGSVGGALMSVKIPDTVFQKIISVLMLVFVVVSVYRERRTAAGKPALKPGPVITFILFFCVGVYGGFIQAGVGLFLIGSIRFATGLDLVKTNSVKVFIIASYTVVAILVFALNGKIDWKIAAAVAVAQGAGGYAGTRIAIKGGEKLVKKLIFAALILMAVKLFLG